MDNFASGCVLAELISGEYLLPGLREEEHLKAIETAMEMPIPQVFHTGSLVDSCVCVCVCIRRLTFQPRSEPAKPWENKYEPVQPEADREAARRKKLVDPRCDASGMWECEGGKRIVSSLFLATPVFARAPLASLSPPPFSAGTRVCLCGCVLCAVLAD